MIEKILEMARKKADQAEVFSISQTRTSVGFENGVLRMLNTAETSGVALRVIKGGRMGFGVSSDLSRIGELVDKTTALSEIGEKAGYSFPGGFQPVPDIAQGNPVDLPAAKMIGIGKRLVSILTGHDGSLEAGAGLGCASETVRVLNSCGFDASYTSSTFGAGVSAELAEEGNMLHVHESYGGVVEPDDYDGLARLCIEKLEAARRNVPIQAGRFRVILSPAALADVLTAFTWYGANGSLAAKGLGPLVGKIGEKILDERISIIDDPLKPGAVCSCPFDDEGVPSRRKHLVEKGIFRGFLTDLKSAWKLGMQSSGNGFRQKPLEKDKSFAAGVAPDISNLVMEPGDMTVDAMRASGGPTVEIHHLTGILLGDMTNGDFSGNLELAFRVKDGRLDGRVKNAMIGGNFYDLFSSNLAGLGAELHHTGNFGGGTGWFLPYACLDDVFIAAKG